MIHNQIWFIAKADFKERTRRFSFLVLCVLAVLAAFLFVPNPNAEMISIAVDAQYFTQATNNPICTFYSGIVYISWTNQRIRKAI